MTSPLFGRTRGEKERVGLHVGNKEPSGFASELSFTTSIFI